MKDSFLIVGHGGRESVFARKLAEDSVVYAIMGHANPSIIYFVEKTEGTFTIGDVNDGNRILQYAIEHNIDYVFISADEPLANGVVDVLLNAGIKVIGPTKEGARIEWDKIYAINIMKKILPKFTPFYKVIESIDEVRQAIAIFEEKSMAMVVKPQGLTGGKGVKVMGEHLEDYGKAREYIEELLKAKDKAKVLLVEKLKGIEFTIMGITDGKTTVFSPASYDYPYRLEGDKGAGTGGMGCFTDKTQNLPFMSLSDFQDCTNIMNVVLDYMECQGLHFNGVLNGGFFLTSDGIKFMEFNGRFGDPEGINILSILNSSFSTVLKNIYAKQLSSRDLTFIPKASVVKYLVSPDYPQKSESIKFKFPIETFEKEGLMVSFASAKRLNGNQDEYQTVSSSRVVALSCVAKTIVEASERINICIDQYCEKNLAYRKDIGTQEDINRLNGYARSMKS